MSIDLDAKPRTDIAPLVDARYFPHMDNEGLPDDGETKLRLKVERRHDHEAVDLFAAMDDGVLRGPSTEVALAVFGTLSVKQLAHASVLWARDVALLLEARKRPPVMTPDPDGPVGIVDITLSDGTSIRVTPPKGTSPSDGPVPSSSVLALLFEHIAQATK